MTTDFTRDLPTPTRALAVGAHPDDIEFGCGGALAKWAAAGCEIRHVVCTDGSKGSWDPAQDTNDLVRERQEEQRAAARALGGDGEVVFLGWVDGELDSTRAHSERVAYWIRAFRPDVVLGHDPWKRYRLHPDHRNAGFLVTDGIVAARDPHFYPSHDVAPHRPSTLLLWEADEPDHLEDVGATVDAKLAALLEHKSQFRSTMRIDDAHDTQQVTRFRTWLEGALAAHGEPLGIAQAEAFKRIDRL